MAEKIGNSKGWWLWLVLGILAILVGLSFMGNFATAFRFIYIFTGVYFLVSGIGSSITTIVDRKYISLWGLKLALHIMVILVGISMLTRPGFALAFIWILCGLGFLFDGISMIVLSIGLKKIDEGSSWILMLIFGILIMLASFAIMANPMVGLFVAVICAAVGAISFGINCIIYAVKVK